VGGGIVWHSTEEGELAEAKLKALVLTDMPPPFSLLETILWEPEGGYRYLEDHIRRMDGSAEYFSFPFQADLVRTSLTEFARNFPALPHKVRMMVKQSGERVVEAEVQAIPESNRIPVIALAASPVLTSNRFLYHKTTHREVYDDARRSSPDGGDVILWNEREELTESTIASLLLEIDGALLTPPVSCGLLPGIARGRLLAEGRIRESVLHRSDLARATRVFLVNSVRGMYEVRFNNQ
jgi:para-aminobenzoate synthetase/4-amino-4-deoxychorismate lyase